MKLIKTLGLAMVAAIAAMSFVGAGTASAEAPYLCKAATLAACNGEAADIYESGTIAKASGAAELIGAFPVKCATSSTEAKLTGPQPAEQGKQILGEVTNLTFTNCKLGEANCTVEVVQLNYTAHIEQAATQGNGTLWVGPGPSALQPGAKITCPTGSCTFKVTQTQPGHSGEWAKLGVIGKGGGAGNRVQIKAEEIVLKRTQGLIATCGETAKWVATYEITEADEPASAPVADPPGWVTH